MIVLSKLQLGLTRVLQNSKPLRYFQDSNSVTHIDMHFSTSLLMPYNSSISQHPLLYFEI